MSISIVVPAYNEKECISDCIREIHVAFGHTDYEIICVDDGSTDSSGSIIWSAAQKSPRMKAVSYPVNRGYSHAIRTGFREATKDYVSFLDADLQYHPCELLKLYDFAKAEKLSFVIGLPKNKYQGFARRIMSRIYNMYVSLLFNIRVADTNSLKLMKRGCLSNINTRYEYGMIEIELLLGFMMQNERIAEFPIQIQERKVGKSKCSTMLAWRTFRDCIRLFFTRQALLRKDELAQTLLENPVVQRLDERA